VSVEMIPTMINERWELLLPAHRAARPEWPHWERERMASMFDLLEPDDVIYDVGAEEGDMPALWATWGCAVAAFEPNPRVWPNMRVIWEANDLPMPIGCFVGFAGPTNTLAVDQLQGTGWHFGQWPVCAYGPVIGDHGFMNLCERPDVPSITLDTASSRLLLPQAITMDVEGAELEVLKGATWLLQQVRPKLWISVHPPFMADMYDQHPDQLHSLMIQHDYVGKLLADDHEQHWLYLPRESTS
jgi:FkbM family methyltransferase